MKLSIPCSEALFVPDELRKKKTVWLSQSVYLVVVVPSILEMITCCGNPHVYQDFISNWSPFFVDHGLNDGDPQKHGADPILSSHQRRFLPKKKLNFIAVVLPTQEVNALVGQTSKDGRAEGDFFRF